MRNEWARVFILVAAMLFLVFAVAGCDDSDSTSSNIESIGDETETPTDDGEVSDTDDEEVSEVSGTVRDAVTLEFLEGVTVEAFEGGILIQDTRTGSNGEYSFELEEGQYDFIFLITGYIEARYDNISVLPNENIFLEPVLQIDEVYSGLGDISGTIVNALTGETIPGVDLNLREGINVQEGEIVASTVTDTNGDYVITDLDVGYYTAIVSSEGYSNASFTVYCIGGQQTEDQDGTMTPILASGETRIVLTWGETPEDLDSHLTGPLENEERFHLFYYYAELCPGHVTCQGSPWPDHAKLDLDDIYSFGPETTTIYQQTDGVYRFSVHDYTNRDSFDSNALSNSGAQVKVYQGDRLVRTFNVPTNRGGTLWTVFELDGTTITPINSMSYESEVQDIRTSRFPEDDRELIRNLPYK